MPVCMISPPRIGLPNGRKRPISRPMPATFLNQRRWEDEFDTKPAPESRSVESKPVDLRIRMYNGSISARSSERESVEDNCKAYNRWMEELGEPHRDYNY